MKQPQLQQTLWLVLGILALTLAACPSTDSSSSGGGDGTGTGNGDGNGYGDGDTTPPPEYVYTALTNDGQSRAFGGVVYRDYITRRADTGSGVETTTFVQLVVTNAADYTFVLEAVSNTLDYYLTMGVKVPVDTLSMGPKNPIPYQYSAGGGNATAGKQGLQFPVDMTETEAEAAITYAGDDGNDYVVSLIETPVDTGVYTGGNAYITYDLKGGYTKSGVIDDTAGEFSLALATTSTDPTPGLNADITMGAEYDTTTTNRGLMKSAAFTVDDRTTFLPNLGASAAVPGAAITLKAPGGENADFLMDFTESGTIGDGEIVEGSYKYTVATNDNQTTPLGTIVAREVVSLKTQLVDGGAITDKSMARLVLSNSDAVFVLEAENSTTPDVSEFYITLGMKTVGPAITATQPQAVAWDDVLTVAYQYILFIDGTSEEDAAVFFTYIGADNVPYLVDTVEAPFSGTDGGTDYDGLTYDLNWSQYFSTDVAMPITVTIDETVVTTSTDPASFLNKDLKEFEAAGDGVKYAAVRSKDVLTGTDRNAALGSGRLSATDKVPGAPITITLDSGDSIATLMTAREQITN